MPEFKDRTGETLIMNNNQKATIIAYRNANDIDVEFEDGNIVRNKSYASFKKGGIKNPNNPYTKSKSRVGETQVMKDGEKATVIAYRGCKNIDVKFENGTVLKNRTYSDFKKGKILYQKNKDRTGETRLMKNNQKATIIAYRNAHDIDVEFEDENIVTNKSYSCFKKGSIGNPNNNTNTRNDRIGETRTMNNKMKATIIAYRKSIDIDVEFEDGNIVRNKSYASFKKGKINIPNAQHFNLKKDRVGETRLMNNGKKATIITYRRHDDIDVKFENGEINRNVTYYNFLRGNVSCRGMSSNAIRTHKQRDQRLGLKNTTTSGLKVRIVEYISATNIVVEFEDGKQVRTTYRLFKRGSIKHPDFNTISYKHANTHVGEKIQATCGLMMELVEYHNCREVVVRFEIDGLLKKGTYDNFKIGNISHPSFYIGTPKEKRVFNNFKIIGKAFSLSNGEVYYKCIDKNGEKCVLTPQQMMNI